MAASDVCPPGFKEISPTYISSDLLSPDHQNRITIPSIGVARTTPQILGGKTWGENLTTYGGIGGLPFLGKTRVRDLEVSRKHTHYSSGLSRYLSKVQPYRLTTLRLSDCRINDQLVPPTFKVDLDPTKLTVRDGIPILPYFSHTCINEMFPRNDPDRTSKRGAQVLNQRTSDALTDYYKFLYETPCYGKAFPDHFKGYRNRIESETPLSDLQLNTEIGGNLNKTQQTYVGNNIMPLLSRLCVMSKGKPIQGSPLMNLLMSCVHNSSDSSMEEVYRVVRALWLFSESFTARQMDLDLGKYPISSFRDVLQSDETMAEKVDKLRKILKDFNEKMKAEANATSKQTNSPDAEYPHIDLLQFREKRHPRLFAKADLEGTAPRWPPSKCYTLDNKSLKLRPVDILRDPCPYECKEPVKVFTPDGSSLGVNPTADDAVVSNLSANGLLVSNSPEGELRAADVYGDSLSAQELGLQMYKNYLNGILPMKFDDRVQSVDENGKVLVQWYHPEPNPEQDMARYEASDKMGRRTYLPPVPLASCLPTAGNRIQDKLGLLFKTEAHKRYHAKYPDSVPDLRDNIRNTKRRVFFYGYHSSAFRG